MATKMYEIGLCVVGKSDDYLRVHAPGSMLPGSLFSISQIELYTGMTKKDEFTLGREGKRNINIINFEYYNNKKDLIKGLENIESKLSDFQAHYNWRTYLRNEYIFTDALMNAIFNKICSNSLWINKEWSLNDVYI